MVKLPRTPIDEKNVKTVKKFHGLNKYSPITSVPPDWAIDLLNVIVSPVGLEKLRAPRNFSMFNFIHFSQDMDMWAGNGGQINAVPDVIIAPDGTLTADRLDHNFNGFTQWPQIIRNIFCPGPMVYSIYLKKGTGNANDGLRISNMNFPFTDAGATINLDTGAVTQQAGVGAYSIDAGNGWWRLVQPMPFDFYAVDILLSAGVTNWAASAIGNSVYIWGAQFEPGLIPTEYTRNIDTTPVATALMNPIYNFLDFQQGNGTRQVITAAGDQLYRCEYDGSSNLIHYLIRQDGDFNAPWSMLLANNIAYLANNVRMLRWTGTALGPWGIGKSVTAPTTAQVAGALTTTLGGYRYRLALKCSATQDEGSGSPASIVTGNFAAKNIQVTPNADITGIIAADPTIDLGVWYRTIDGGTEYLFHSEVAVAAGTVPVLTDSTADGSLTKLRTVSLVNDPPPLGRYIAEWGGRIYLVTNKHDVAYSGYERIRNARPENCFPPNNRIRTAIGADDLKGLGVCEIGVIAFSRSDEMFMFRGVPEDIVTDEPVAYSAQLVKLPWGIGCYSHHSIVGTMEGLIWLDANRAVQVYNGSGKPICISTTVSPILRDITPGDEAAERIKGVYWGELDRDWYVLAIPTDGSSRPNKILVFDLDDNQDALGIFLFDIGTFDTIGILEDPETGRERLIVAQGGRLNEIIAINTTTGGINIDADTKPGVQLNAYWVPGYNGSDSPDMWKMFRYASFVADNPEGFKSNIRMIDDGKTRTVRTPEIIPVLATALRNGKISINRKAIRCTADIIFPEQDANCCVTEYTPPVYINTGRRSG